MCAAARCPPGVIADDFNSSASYRAGKGGLLTHTLKTGNGAVAAGGSSASAEFRELIRS